MKEVKNPYWDVVKTIPGDPVRIAVEGIWQPDGSSFALPDEFKRFSLARSFSWSIPDPESIDFVVKYSQKKVVEMGAGTGYWAWMLKQHGVHVIAFDHQPPKLKTNEYGHEAQYYPILEGTPERLKYYRKRVLFLSWPPYHSDMGYYAVTYFKGNRLIYIGEGRGGCTGTDKLYDELESHWKPLDIHSPVQWSGIHDQIVVYERNNYK